MKRSWALVVLAVAFVLSSTRASSAAGAAVAVAAQPNGILWIDPGDVRSRDLFYGPGGKEGQPREPLTFRKEDRGGTNPKFDVSDATGTHWKAKLGLEARPETAATRLLWAIGFVTNKNYFLPEVKVAEMPHQLHRGQQLAGSDGTVRSVRLQRPPESNKVGTWDWKHNPFVGTREFNGLRVMMALLNNWDLRKVNNAVYAESKKNGPVLYEVSDLGATFGRNGESYTNGMSKSNLAAYRKARFITKVTPERVSFNFPTHLPYLYIFNFPHFFSQNRQRWIGRNIPRSDAKWIGGLLARLSHQQICDAFRAAGYSHDQTEAFAAVVEARIKQLEQL
jgi:hypothetical protein